MEYSRYEKEKHLLKTKLYKDEEEAEQLKLDFFNDINYYLDTFSNGGYEEAVLCRDLGFRNDEYTKPCFIYQNLREQKFDIFFAMKIISETQYNNYVCKLFFNYYKEDSHPFHEFRISTNEITWILNGLPLFSKDDWKMRFYLIDEKTQLEEEVDLRNVFIYGLKYKIVKIHNILAAENISQYVMSNAGFAFADRILLFNYNGIEYRYHCRKLFENTVIDSNKTFVFTEKQSILGDFLLK